MLLTTITKSQLPRTRLYKKLHFRLLMTEIGAEILGLFELQTQSETCGQTSLVHN